MVLTETWLNSSHFSSEFFDKSCHVYRKDRYETGSSLGRGGGVLIAVNTRLSSENIVLPNSNNLEYVCVKVSVNENLNVFIYAAYVPPCSPQNHYNDHLASIHSIPAGKNDIVNIMADFNLPKVDWIVDDSEQKVLVPISVSPQYAADFLEGIANSGVCQINPIRNARNELLDLMFTNDYVNVEVSSPPPLSTIDKQYHPPILLSYEWHVSDPNETSLPTLNFYKADYDSMNTYFARIDWYQCFSNKLLDEKVDALHEILASAINEYVPSRVKKNSEKCPWKNETLKSLKNKKNKEWKRAKKTGDKSRFVTAVSEFSELNTKLYNDYVNKMSSTIKSDPSSFWRFVNSKKNTDSFPKHLHLGANSSADGKEQAEFFATFFKKNFAAQQTQQLNRFHDPIQPNSGAEQFQLENQFVLNELLKINTKKGAGPDEIHPLLLKNCAATLYWPLAHIFNESLATGSFPNKWKRCSVTPIFKKGSRSNVENYRCIAKLPTIAKFFEYLINVELKTIVADKIVPQQHGFMSGRSTTSNLLEFQQFALKSLNDGKQIDVLYTDFSKAFDIVDHSILFSKLRNFDLPNNLVEWIGSYLSKRSQFVKYNNMESSDFIVNSGVPQGSHLGPTLFLLFINDIVRTIDGSIFVSLFADDLKMATVINNNSDTNKLQSSINKLKMWCKSNKLYLNLNKCSIMSISRKRNLIVNDYFYGDHQFVRVNEQRDLGVIVDNKLNFIKHIESIVAKASSALGFVKRFSHDFCDVHTQKSLYCALVQSILEYGSLVWLPYYDIHKNKIESCLRQFTMFALKEYPNASNNYKISSYSMRLDKLNMQSLQRRRINAAVMFMYDLLQENAHCPSLRSEIAMHQNERNLRNVNCFKINDKGLRNSPAAPLTQICKMSNKVHDLFATHRKRPTFKKHLIALSDNIFSNLSNVSNYSTVYSNY